VFNLSPWLLYLWEIPFKRRLSELQNWCGCWGEEKNLWPLPGFEPSCDFCSQMINGLLLPSARKIIIFKANVLMKSV
jgi:hypothetical protein